MENMKLDAQKQLENEKLYAKAFYSRKLLELIELSNESGINLTDLRQHMYEEIEAL